MWIATWYLSLVLFSCPNCLYVCIGRATAQPNDTVTTTITTTSTTTTTTVSPVATTTKYSGKPYGIILCIVRALFSYKSDRLLITLRAHRQYNYYLKFNLHFKFNNQIMFFKLCVLYLSCMMNCTVFSYYYNNNYYLPSNF